MTINRLIESMVINLSLTGGNGFYHSEGKESLWTGRKMVIRDKETGMTTQSLYCLVICGSHHLYPTVIIILLAGGGQALFSCLHVCT